MISCFYSHIIFQYVPIGFNFRTFEIHGLPLKISSFTLVADTLSPSLYSSSLSLSVCSLCRSFSTHSSPVPDSTCSHHSHSLTRFSSSHFTRYSERHSCLCGNTALAAIGPPTLPFRLYLSRRAVRPTSLLSQNLLVNKPCQALRVYTRFQSNSRVLRSINCEYHV